MDIIDKIRRNINLLLGERTQTFRDKTWLCWFGQHSFSESQAKYHETCDTLICPICQKCYCHLSPEAKEALDAEAYSLGIWKDPWSNPPKRKKRGRH
jgi:hypothetical protein